MRHTQCSQIAPRPADRRCRQPDSRSAFRPRRWAVLAIGALPARIRPGHCPSLVAPPWSADANQRCAKLGIHASQPPCEERPASLPGSLVLACPPWQARLAAHTAASLAALLPAAPASLRRAAGIPASGQLRWAVAACSRQAAPGFAPASPWWAAVAAATADLMAVAAQPCQPRRLRRMHVAARALSQRPSRAGPGTARRSVPLALALGCAPGAGTAPAAAPGPARRSRGCCPKGCGACRSAAARQPRSRRTLGPARGAVPAPPAGPAPALRWPQRCLVVRKAAPRPPSAHALRQAPGIGSRWPRRGWARSAHTPPPGRVLR